MDITVTNNNQFLFYIDNVMSQAEQAAAAILPQIITSLTTAFEGIGGEIKEPVKKTITIINTTVTVVVISWGIKSVASHIIEIADKVTRVVKKN